MGKLLCGPDFDVGIPFTSPFFKVSSGLPVRNGNKHASEIACMALDLKDGIAKFVVPHRPNELIQIRIGINSGNISRKMKQKFLPVPYIEGVHYFF